MKNPQPPARMPGSQAWGPQHARVLATLVAIYQEIENLQEPGEGRRACREVRSALKKQLEKIRPAALPRGMCP